MYDTETIIKHRLEKIINQFRSRFFEEFGSQSYDGLIEPLKIRAIKKAFAYYTVAYNGRQHGLTHNVYSFPWIVWDVLCNIDAVKRTTECRRNKTDVACRLTDLIQVHYALLVSAMPCQSYLCLYICRSFAM